MSKIQDFIIDIRVCILTYFYTLTMESLHCCSLNFASICTVRYSQCVIPNILLFLSNKCQYIIAAGIIQNIILWYKDKFIVQFNANDFWNGAILYKYMKQERDGFWIKWTLGLLPAKRMRLVRGPWGRNCSFSFVPFLSKEKQHCT